MKKTISEKDRFYLTRLYYGKSLPDINIKFLYHTIPNNFIRQKGFPFLRKIPLNVYKRSGYIFAKSINLDHLSKKFIGK